MKKSIRSILARHSAEIYFLSCMLGIIPAIASNVIVQSFSIIPLLGIGEKFGWIGIQGLDYLRIVISLTVIVAILVFFSDFTLKSRKLRLWHVLALLPSTLLIVLRPDAIGSVMQYDASSVSSLVTQPAWVHSIPFLDHTPTLKDSIGSLNVVERAKMELVNRIGTDRKDDLINLPYYITSAALIIFYLCRFGFRRVGLAAILASSFLLALIANCDWSGSWLLWLLASAYPIAAFTLLCVLIRFLFRAYSDNLPIWERLRENAAEARTFPSKAPQKAGPENADTFQLARMFLYWSPFLAAFIGTLWFGLYLSETIEDWTYKPDLPNLELIKALEGKSLVKPVLKDSRGADVRQIRDDLNIILIDAFEKARSGLAGIDVAKSPDAFKDTALGAFDATIRPSLEDYSPSFRIDGGCVRFSLRRIRFSFPCLARDLKNSVLNSIYQIPKNAIRNFVIRTADQAIYQAKSIGAPAAAAKAKEAIVNGINSWRLTLVQGVDLGWLTLAMISFLGTATLIQSVVRAFLIIVGRLLVRWDRRDAHETRNYFSMSPVEIDSSGRIDVKLAEQGELTLSLEKGETFYVKHSLDVANANRNVCLPIQPFTNIFSRLFNRRYFLKKLEKNNPRPLKITDIGSNRFVAIRLGPKDRIAFRWANFVGMTNNATIEYLLSLRPSLLVLGHARIPTLKGPGLLVLKVSGAAALARRGQDSDTVAPYRLIAWDASAWFRIASSRNFFSLYVDDCQIDILNDDQAIFDIGRDGRSMPGLFYQLRNTIRP